LWHHLSNGGKFAALREAVWNKDAAGLAIGVIVHRQLLLKYQRRNAKKLRGPFKGIAKEMAF
jgi:hypothetical protein